MKSFTDERVEKYLYAMLPEREPVLQEMERQAKARDIPIVGPTVGRLFYQYARLIDAKTVFELGSAIGYSTIWWAKAVGEGGKVHYTDGSRKNADEARRYFEQAGVADRIQVHIGDALEVLSERKEEFDIVFNDVDKHDYPRVFNMAAARVRKGGLFIADNALWSGEVAYAAARRRQGHRRDVLASIERVESADREGLGAVEVVGRGTLVGCELQRQHAHAHEIGTVNSLVALDEHGLHTEQLRPLGRPVAARSGAVLLAGDDHERRALGLVGHGGVEDRHLGALGELDGHAPFGARRHLVADPDVGEGAAHHDLVVPSSRAVAVEIGRHDAAVDQIPPGGRRSADVAGWRDVVRRHRVTELREHARAGEVSDHARLHRETVEVRRELHVGGRRVPGVGDGVGGRHILPTYVAAEGAGVALFEHRRRDRRAHGLGDLGVTGPEVRQEHRLLVDADAERFVGEVDIHRSGQRVGDDERRAREEVLLDVGVDATLEVPVAGQHRHDREVVFVDGFGDAGEQRSGVADARRAPVSGEIEAQGVEGLHEVGALEVIHHDATARGERCLHPRLRAQPELDGSLGDESGRDQHGGVGGIRARRDRRHDDGTLAKGLGHVHAVDFQWLSTQGVAERASRARQ